MNSERPAIREQARDFSRAAYKRLTQAWVWLREHSSPALVAACLCLALQGIAALLDAVLYGIIQSTLLGWGYNASGMGPQSASTGSAGVLLGQVSTAIFLLPTYAAIVRRNAQVLFIAGINAVGLLVIWITPVVGILFGRGVSSVAFLLAIMVWLTALGWAFLDVLRRLKIVDELLGPETETHHEIHVKSRNSNRRKRSNHASRESNEAASAEGEDSDISGIMRVEDGQPLD